MSERSPHVPDKKCAQEGCGRTFRDHQWGATQAHKEGWFHQQNGDSWCPEHNPDWVKEWRAKRAAGIPPQPWRKA